MYQRKTTIINRTGIHARPASVFVNEAKNFQSNITICNLSLGVCKRFLGGEQRKV